MKKFLCLLLTCILMMTLVACEKSSSKSEYTVYYINTDKTSIVSTAYEYTSTSMDGMIREALEQLASDTEDVDYMTTIPSGVSVSGYEVSDGALSLYLTGAYDELDIYTEVLVRAAIVKTLVQIDGVDSVSMYLDNSPLTDSNGDAIGSMTADTFIDNFGEETDSLLSSELTLYFASADGMSLVAETREVYFSHSVAIEKLVIDQLLNGPESDELLSAIPDGTKLNSISVSDDGICYVNFDATLETGVSGITENVTVYSIVDSLTELDSVKQVQILVNGETPHLSNVDADLTAAISRNEDIINESIDDEDEYYAEDEEDESEAVDSTDETVE